MSPLFRRHPTHPPLRHCAAACLLALNALGSHAATALPDNTPAAPAQWSQPSSTTPDTLAQWWNQFNDAQLSSLVLQALQANPSLRKAEAALQQARALRDAKQGSLLPSLKASGSGQRNQTNDQAATNTFRAGLDASWEPDLFGGQGQGLNATEADAQAQQATLAGAQVSLAAEVVLAYLQLRGLQNQLAIGQRNLASQQETLQLTDWRAQAGLVTSLEVEQARTAVEQTSADLPSLRASIAASQHSLAVLSGQAPTALVEQLNAATSNATPNTIPSIPRAPEDLALAFPADTLRQRPDVRAEEARITAALARVQVANAARYPSFSIGGSLGVSALTLAGLTNGASVLSSLLASVSMPLFDGGTTAANLRAQEAALIQAQASYQSTVLSALKEVEDALASLRGHRSRLQHLQGAASAAESAALLAQQRYASGLIDFQTVLTTQRTLLSAQNNVASTQTDLGTDFVRLYKALGGGWQPTPTSSAGKS